MDAKPVHIYRLSSSESPDEFRYVGQTVRWPLSRRAHHLSRYSYPVTLWARKVRAEGHTVIYSLVCTVAPAEADDAETLAIAEYRDMGYDMLNVKPGGSASRGFSRSEEAKAKMRAAWDAPGARDRRTAAVREAAARPEVRAKVSAAVRGHWQDEERKQARVEATKRGKRTPESLAKRSASAKAAHARPETKKLRAEVMRAARDRPEYGSNLGAAVKAAFARPEVRERRRVSIARSWDDPGVRERRSAGIRAAFLRKKLGDAPTLFDAPDEDAA